MQDNLFKGQAILTEDLENTKDKELRTRLAMGLSSLVKTWDIIEDRIRIFKNKPMPGSLRPEPKPRKPRRTKQGYHNNEPVDPSMLKEASKTPEAPTPPGAGEGNSNPG